MKHDYIEISKSALESLAGMVAKLDEDNKALVQIIEKLDKLQSKPNATERQSLMEKFNALVN
ncbi:MAG: hypothetical protein KGI54_08855 [Pseudomonadota bacterium]|nr:hypothetical protein [Pseudomonadota bacterium]